MARVNLGSLVSGLLHCVHQKAEKGVSILRVLLQIACLYFFHTNYTALVYFSPMKSTEVQTIRALHMCGPLHYEYAYKRGLHASSSRRV